VAMAYLPSAAPQPTATASGQQRVLSVPTLTPQQLAAMGIGSPAAAPTGGAPALRPFIVGAAPTQTPLKPAPSATVRLGRSFEKTCGLAVYLSLPLSCFAGECTSLY
jgi:hypothetical protein